MSWELGAVHTRSGGQSRELDVKAARHIRSSGKHKGDEKKLFTVGLVRGCREMRLIIKSLAER